MKVKVANLRQPGQPIMFNYGGKNYNIGDREIVHLPERVINHLAEDCIMRTYEQKEVVGKNGQPRTIDRPVEIPRFSVSPVAREFVNVDLKGKNDTKSDKSKSKA